jgi:hypothetical protein
VRRDHRLEKAPEQIILNRFYDSVMAIAAIAESFFSHFVNLTGHIPYGKMQEVMEIKTMAFLDKIHGGKTL